MCHMTSGDVLNYSLTLELFVVLVLLAALIIYVIRIARRVDRVMEGTGDALRGFKFLGQATGYTITNAILKTSRKLLKKGGKNGKR